MEKASIVGNSFILSEQLNPSLILCFYHLKEVCGDPSQDRDIKINGSHSTA